MKEGNEDDSDGNSKQIENDDKIKSKAIVKLASVQVPANFARLQYNTNLNQPPSNWLSNSMDSFGLQHALCNTAGFSSFEMAHMFPDCVGEVDVVSAAENIKHLLKLPYASNSAVSMMVHRIENTLLIDDFDIHKYLLRKSDDDWKWLRSYILENKSFDEKDLNFLLKNKTRDSLQQKNLISKFLYHSLKHEKPESEDVNEQDESVLKKFDRITKASKKEPRLPEPNINEILPEPNKSHIYNRNVLWTFEDIRMLIGSDMPIFGGGTMPCISLRLRDMNQPINVLTGIDYWLDNLMCNVPEVIMCYHLDGIVQKYELVKTEDLPNLENSNFSPKVIRNVAQNILSFLKSKATKSGHTYWLFKGRNDDVVKLYDLTTLCSDTTSTHEQSSSSSSEDDNSEKSENPFTIPVAMLLYSVARNLKNSSVKISPKRAGSIKSLLDNCIQLLPKEKYPQIVTSSYYLLSDLHIPSGLNPRSPEFDAIDDESDGDDMNGEMDEANEHAEDEESVAVKIIQETMDEYNLDENIKHNTSPPPLTGSVTERCEIALTNILNGLGCLQYFESSEEKLEREKIRHEADNPQMAKSNQPIPLPYEPLLNLDHKMSGLVNSNLPIALGWKPGKQSTTKTKKQRKSKAETTPQKTAPPPPEEKLSPRTLITRNEKSWNIHLKILLLEKTCLTYETLAEISYTSENYGLSLRYIYIALRCQQIITNYDTSKKSQKSSLLGRAADCFFQFSKNWTEISNYLKEFKTESDIDKQISSELFKDIGNTIEGQLPMPLDNIEQLMRTSCACYEVSLESASPEERIELLRRLGNVRNELGLKYMDWAQVEYHKYCEEYADKLEPNENKEVLYVTLTCKSLESLTKGIAAFEEADDPKNLAFLLSNFGRFMRFRAHIHLPGEVPENTAMMKKFYYDSFTYYNRAFAILGERKFHPELWDLINWEFCTATFTLAKQLQDNTVKTEQNLEELEMEVVQMLKKSLKLCDVDTPGIKQIWYQFRSAMIHHRLASYYHNLYRTSQGGDAPLKTTLSLAFLHYDKSIKILENMPEQEPKEYIEIQLERIGLQEYQAELKSNPQKIRILERALQLMQESQNTIKVINTLKTKEYEDEMFKNLKLFEERLQLILRTLIKLYSERKDANGEKMMTNYKNMYRCSLSTERHENVTDLSQHLYNILEKIKSL